MGLILNRNVIIGYPNRADAAVFSGGSWLPALPAMNLGNRELSKVARSTNLAAASTVFNGDMSQQRLLRTFALCNHNLSATATWRVTLGGTPGASDIWNSGWRSVWTLVFDNLVEWESVTWWSGTSGDEYLRSQYAAMIVAPDLYLARYLTVEISDAGNVDGYVQIGRLFAGGAIQPAYNRSYGLQNAWRDLSTLDTAESGAVWATERRRLRFVSFNLEWLNETEAAYLHEMQRQVGTVDEVLYVPDPNDMSASQRYGFLGRLSELSAIEDPYCRTNRMPIKIEELA